MKGGELFDKIQSSKITERDAAMIMRQIGMAVQVWHLPQDASQKKLLVSSQS